MIDGMFIDGMNIYNTLNMYNMHNIHNIHNIHNMHTLHNMHLMHKMQKDTIIGHKRKVGEDYVPEMLEPASTEQVKKQKISN